MKNSKGKGLRRGWRERIWEDDERRRSYRKDRWKYMNKDECKNRRDEGMKGNEVRRKKGKNEDVIIGK